MSAVWEEWHRQLWTDSLPAPLDMTDKEILDWVSEYGEKLEWHRGTDREVGYWKFTSDEFSDPVKAKTLRGVVCQAAAILEENR